MQVAALAAASDASPDLRHFAGLLLTLVRKGNTYSEIDALKPLCAFTAEAGTRPAPEGEPQQQTEQRRCDVRCMQALLAQLLLLPNSRPLHKQLLSGLRPLLERQRQQGTAAAAGEESFAEAAAARCAQLAEECLQQQGSTGADSKQQLLQRALRLGSALSALLANLACKLALLRCAVPAVAALAAGLQAALAAGVRAAPQPSGDGGDDSAALSGAEAADAAGPEAAVAAAAEAQHITTDVMEGLQDCSELLPLRRDYLLVLPL